MNFARFGAGEVSARNSGSVFRSAQATMASEGAMPGLMVRSHEPKEAITRPGTVVASDAMMPWATSPICMRQL